MREVTVLNGQTIFDIAVQECGDVCMAYDIAVMNSIDVFSDLKTGTTLIVPDIVNKQVARIFERDSKPISKSVINAPSQITKIEMSYSDLVFLRDNGVLQAGQYYCITDYETTTAQRNTYTAGHRFNIIVQAVTNYELSESAKVCAVAGDEYFVKNKLAAWNIKYCLDNDIRRFAWADADGKGVIYYMCDENGNTAPYDFKNILFGENYTFGLSGEDFSLNCLYCRNNEIRPYVVDGVQLLNGNILDNLYEGDCSNNFFDHDCHDNYLVDNCNDNRFASGCHGNILYYNCNNNVFGVGCCNNIFEDSCSNNVFETGCCNNQFGVLCQDNRFSSSCSNNILKQRSSRNLLENFCRYISMGRNSSNNRFGARCSNNTLGDGAVGNTFGSGCQNNILGNGCQYNSYGNYCMNISFRVSPNLPSAVVNYVHQCHVSDGCSYIVIYTRPSSSDLLQNIMIKRGVSGTASEYVFVLVMEYNAGYEIMVARKTSGEIITYCEADLAQ